MDKLSALQLLTQFNNLGLLIFAYVVEDKHLQSGCQDPSAQHFLHWILYGSSLVYGVMVVLYLLWLVGLIERVVSILSCNNAVCVALNAIGAMILAVGFHVLSMGYGIFQLYWREASQCLELRLFVRACGDIYLIWLVAGTGLLLASVIRRRCAKE